MKQAASHYDLSGYHPWAMHPVGKNICDPDIMLDT